MGGNVLVPVDGSDPAAGAVEFAVRRFPESALTLLYVIDPMIEYSRHRAFPGYRGEDEYSSEQEKGEAIIETHFESIPEDVDVGTEFLVGKPSRAIVTYAADADVDHIVLGSHGRVGPARHLLGSVAENVVRRADVPVTVVRDSAAD